MRTPPEPPPEPPAEPPAEPPSDPSSEGVAGAKRALRDRLLAARRDRSPAELGAAAEAIAGHALAWVPVRRAGTVAAYVSVGAEPGTGPLLERLHAAGVRVLLPVVLPGLDLDWSAYDGPASLDSAALGLLEPTGPRLGVDAVRGADVVLLPGLGVSRAGDRIGRGGGCYDRALARVAERPVAVLLHTGEVGHAVPTEPHDRPVTHAITPDGVVALGGPGLP